MENRIGNRDAGKGSDLFSRERELALGRQLSFVADDAKNEKPPTHLTFLLNFFDELRRRAPGK